MMFQNNINKTSLQVAIEKENIEIIECLVKTFKIPISDNDKIII